MHKVRQQKASKLGTFGLKNSTVMGRQGFLIALCVQELELRRRTER